MNWYVGTDWSVIPAGGNSLRQVFVRLEDYEADLADAKADADLRWGNGFQNAKLQFETRIRELESMMRGQTFQTPDEKDARIKTLETALREARPWIKEDTEALEACHTPYDPDNDIDDQVRLEVDARREWLRSTAVTSIEPIKGGQLCHLCNAVHDLMSACPPKGAQPGIGPIEPEPQDYKVQCRCGWMGQVSALKSLPDFKMGCPDCSAEFVPLNKMTFPVDRASKPCWCNFGCLLKTKGEVPEGRYCKQSDRGVAK